MIAKHLEIERKRGKSALPDIGTYNPEPVEYNSFTKIMQLAKKKDKASLNVRHNVHYSLLARRIDSRIPRKQNLK